MDETTVWYKSFVAVSKPGKLARLGLAPVRVNEALIQSIHRGSTFNVFHN